MGRTVEASSATAGISARPATAAMGLCAVAVAVSLALRALYLTEQWRIDLSMPRAFLAGEGILAIMARHILAGARPVFVYGQAYLGAFEEYIEAAVFALLGESMTTLRLVPTAFAIAWVPLTGAIAGRLYGRRAGFLAAALIALPSQFAFEWSSVAWGGHAHVAMVLFAAYLLLLALERPSQLRLAAVGFVAGFSVWVNQLAVGYLPVYGLALLAWLRLSRKQVALVVIAGLVGLSPLLYGNVVEPLGTARNLAFRVRSSWRLSAQLVRQKDDQSRFYRSIPLFQVLGAQPRHDGKWSTTGSLAAAFLVLGGIAGAGRAFRLRDHSRLLFRGSMLVLACAGISVFVGISGFFGQPVARYNLPLYPLLCVLAAGGLEGVPRFAIAAVGLVLLGNAVQIASPIQEQARTPNGVVIKALLERDLRYGYGADNMYDLVFESGEQVIIEPLEWTRYAPYRSAVAASDRIFYLYRDEQERKISYQVFMEHLHKAGIRYRRLDIGEYRVLYDLEPAERLSAEAIRSVREQIRARKGRHPAARSRRAATILPE